jgi:type VII secretion integral membrane protein EccD
MTVSDLCRVTVQTNRMGRSVAVDLALPTRLELGELLPCVVDIVGGETDETTNRLTDCWAISRLDGLVLDESMTLHENGVRDGDMLLLTTAHAPIPAALAYDLCHTVVGTSATADRDDGWARRMAAVGCLWAAGLGAMVLGWCGTSPASDRAVITAIVAVAASAGSIVAGRVDPEPLPTLTLGITAAAFASLAGFLVVPGGPAPPNLFLAAAICSAVSILLLQATSRGTTCFIAIAAFSTTAAIAAALAALWPAPLATVGAVLAAASLAVLNAAAKLSIVLAGLSPRLPGATEGASGDETMPAAFRAARAERGHQTLTGLLAGFSASAALGAVLVAADQRHGGALSGVVLTAVVSAVLLLRARQQLGIARIVAVLTAGMVSATASFTLVALSAPRRATWVCLVAVALGAGALYVTRMGSAAWLSPVARRSLELVDYLGIAAVVPLTCWVGDVFGFARGLSLT